MLSVVTEAFKKPVMFLCTPFANRCFFLEQLCFILPCILSSPVRLVEIHLVQICLIRILDSPDHRSVSNKEVKFI